MVRLITLRFFKILKSLINLFLSLVIKSIKTFSFLFLIKKYYSYLKIIFNTLKKFNHYYIFKYFIKSLAIFNILLSVFTIFILSDIFNYGYLTLFENDLFIKTINYFKRIFKYINDLFFSNKIENDITTVTDVKVENKIPKDFYIYILCFTVFTTFSLAIYNNIIDISPIITTITSFFSGLFGRDDDDTGSSDNPDITLFDNRTNQDKTKSNTVFYTKETGDKAKALENRLNEILQK